MPLCHKHKLAFIHVPRTGGISIEKSLGIRWSPKNLLGRNRREEGFLTSPQHWPVSRVRKHMDGWFTFAFVRNPYTRILSKFLLENKSWDSQKFDRWVTHFVYKRYDHAMPQTFFLDEPVDFIGRFENLTEDFQEAMRQAGVNLSINHHESKTEHEKESLIPKIAKETISIINDVFHEDFERFGYLPLGKIKF